MSRRTAIGWGLGTVVAAGTLGLPAVHYRYHYEHSRRLRVVAPGKAYRSGQLTSAGFRDAVARYGIRTVVNLQEEARDPLLPEVWGVKPHIRESELLDQLGVTYVPLDGGVLDLPGQDPGSRPKVIDDFLAVFDHPERYPPPVLFHCKAGLHRTGLMAAVYRMEYEGRSVADVVRELRANGFGTFAATDGNVYLDRFILKYRRGAGR